MAQETSNYKLIKPDDGALQWGEDLNANFDTIDRGLSSLATSAANSLVCAGLFGNPSIQYQKEEIKNDITVCKQIDFINVDCYFPQYTSNNGIIQANRISLQSSDFSTEDNAYKVYHVLLGFDPDASIPMPIFYTEETFNSDGTNFNGGKIYLGTIVLLKISEETYFVKDLCCFTPWFANYTVKDRIENFNAIGTIQNLILESNGTTLKTKDASIYNWYLEGINSYKDDGGDTLWATNNSVATNFLTKSSLNNLALYMVIDNNKYDASELTVKDEIVSGQYWNGSSLSTIADGKYVIYRISIAKNKTLAVFYPTAEYNSFSEARSAATRLDPLQTSIPQKEVARLIADKNFSKVEIYNFYSDEYNVDGINSYLFYTDSQKEGYTLADASEIRSNGILPIWDEEHCITLSGTTLTAKGVGCIINNKYNFQDSTLINYFEFDTNYNLNNGTTEGINYIYINQDNTITISSGDISLGYYFKGTTYNKWICCPDLCTTTPDKRSEREYDHLHIPNGIVSWNDKKVLGFNNESPELYGEGINYNSNADKSNFNKKILGTTINFAYIEATDQTKTNWKIISNIGTSYQNTTANYSVQILVLTTDGNFFMIPGENISKTTVTGDDVFQVQNHFPPTIGIELARILFNGTTPTALYYTNKNYIGSIQIAAGTATEKTTKFDQSLFDVHNDTNTFTVNVSNSFVLTSSKTATTTTGPSYDLNTITTNIANNSTAIGTPDDTAKETGSLYARINYQANRIDNISSSIISEGTSVPSTFTTWIFVKTDTNSVYIWDKKKYQLMNSWQ